MTAWTHGCNDNDDNNGDHDGDDNNDDDGDGDDDDAVNDVVTSTRSMQLPFFNLLNSGQSRTSPQSNEL